MRPLALILMVLTGCTGLAWNTTLADHPQVRGAMLASIVPGATTEARFRAQWGNPTQRMREGAQVAWVYRNMTNPPEYLAPQFGDSTAYVVVLFQYGVAVGGYSSDTEGCRATFAPRPPGDGWHNPSTVRPVHCGVPPGADRGRDRGVLQIVRDFGGAMRGTGEAPPPSADPSVPLGVPDDSYEAGAGGKYK